MTERRDGPWLYRHLLPTRLWHWLNAMSILIMLMSGLMIFNAHPRLYWGQYGANFDRPWLQIGGTPDGRGHVVIGRHIEIPTTGVLGRWTDPQGRISTRAFPYWATLPSRYSLSAARRWHFLFAWVLVLGGLVYVIASLINRHFRRDLLPSRREAAPRHIWQDIKDHARLRFPRGRSGRTLQHPPETELRARHLRADPADDPDRADDGTGLQRDLPAIACPVRRAAIGAVDPFPLRRRARFFVFVHLAMVVLAGPIREVRSMITGWFKLPPERAHD
jgi:thiosulfate reductase cytochrome b subunit